MGYLLAFVRSMQVSAKKNQYTYEQMSIQSQQERITNELGSLQQMADMISKMPEDSEQGQGALMGIQLRKQMLTMMSGNLETRLKFIQTQIQAAAAEEAKINEALPNQIAASAPKYR